MTKKEKEVIEQLTLGSKNIETLNKFCVYCLAHKNERFMQALRNFLKVNYVGVSQDGKKWEDTFYL